MTAPGQIVLGAETMAEMGKQVGDTVTIDASQHTKPIRLTIVGTATLPALVGPGMGTGAIIDYRLIPASARNTQGSAVTGPNAYLIRTNRASVPALRSLEGINDTINLPSSPSSGSAGGVVSQLRPEEIVNSHSIVVIPAVLGASLAVGAALALGTTLVASVRRRRRDLAVLKTLGLSGRQLGTVIVWQSSVTVVIGTIIGVPLGIILGHVLWTGFAEAINAVPVTSVPPLYVAAIAVGAVVLANIVAAVPARFAARTLTAELFRAEQRARQRRESAVRWPARCGRGHRRPSPPSPFRRRTRTCRRSPRPRSRRRRAPPAPAGPPGPPPHARRRLRGVPDPTGSPPRRGRPPPPG